jgi:hypothetical protein
MNLKQFWRHLYNEDVTPEWVESNEQHIKKYISYAWNVFLDTPRIAKFINNDVNNYSFNNYSLYERVKYLQSIVQQSGVSYTDLRFSFPQFEKRKSYNDQLKMDTGDIKGLYGLHKLGVINIENQIVQHDSKKPIKLSKQEKEQIQQVIVEYDAQQVNSVANENTDEEITHLTQEVIDELELTLFDIMVLDKMDMIMYVFIDKYNKKRVYKEPFTFTFRFSTKSSVIENDYFLPTDQLHEYTLTSVQEMRRLKQLINQSFEEFS